MDFEEDIGVINILQESERRIDVEWKVENILRKFEKHGPIYSHLFTWSSCCWYLKMEFVKEIIELYLYKCKHLKEVSSVFRFGIELTDGTTEMRFYVTKGFHCKEIGFGTIEFIKRSELEERKDELLPNGVLTVVCSLAHRIFSTKPHKIKYNNDKSDSNLTVSRRIWRNFLESSLSHETLSTDANDLVDGLASLSVDVNNLYVKKLSSDLHLRCGSSTYRVHKAILAARSKVFDVKFRDKTIPICSKSSGSCLNDTTLSKEECSIMEVKDIDPSVFSIFLRFLYSGVIINMANLSKDMVIKLYDAGEKYAIYNLKRRCVNFMLNNMKEDNFLTYLTFADSCKDEEFRNAIICTIAKDDTLLKSEVWFAFSKENPALANEIYLAYFQK